MWILLVITIINGGQDPAKFETTKFQTLGGCIYARRVAEKDLTKHGYCNYEPVIKL